MKVETFFEYLEEIKKVTREAICENCTGDPELSYCNCAGHYMYHHIVDKIEEIKAANRKVKDGKSTD